jgi:hypothetical protein
MSHQASHHGTASSRNFIPEVKSLERRCLLSTTIPSADVIVGNRHPPRTGALAIESGLEITDFKITGPSGRAIQRGSVLICSVDNPKGNTVQVSDDGEGHVAMSWNFGQPQTFTGVATTIINSKQDRPSHFTFNLTQGDTVTPAAMATGTTFQQLGPSVGSTGVELSPRRPSDALSAKAAGRPLAHFHNEPGGLTVETDSEMTVAANRPQDEKTGAMVQTGSELTVTANRPTTNVVQITDRPGSNNVQVELNGGMVHSFTGVATIVVNALNARRDQVTLQDSISETT